MVVRSVSEPKQVEIRPKFNCIWYNFKVPLPNLVGNDLLENLVQAIKSL
jgi:hypothetical protein